MKIALVILHADPSRGGAERYTHDLAAALGAAGHDVSLLATSFAQRPEKVQQIDLPASGATRTRRYLRALDSLDHHLDRMKYDIVHAMFPVRRCDVYHPHAGLAVAALQGANRKLQALLNPRRLRMAAVERTLLNSPNPPVVLALSQYVRRSIRYFYPLPDAQLPVLFNAVDLNYFTPSSHAKHEGTHALFIGQDFQRKGLPAAMKAVEMTGGVHLFVVGRNRGYRSSRSCSFVGQVRDPRPFYRDADFLVLPTKHDPCSLVVLEALAMGMPVITTRCNGASEIMTHDVHGMILDDPRDVSALSNAMIHLSEPAVRARMSQACLALRPKLAYEQHLSTLLDIYSRIVAQRN